MKKVMKNRHLFVLHVLLVDMLSCFEDWFTVKNIRNDEALTNLAKFLAFE